MNCVKYLRMKSFTASSHKQKFSKSNNSKTIRNISLLIKIQIIFSDVKFFIGFVFFVMGSFFMIIFGSMINFDDLKFSKNSPVTKGYITNSRTTNSYVNDQAVIEYSYEYTTQNGQQFTGTSFTTDYLSDSINVTYLANNPETSKIQNTNSGAFPYWVIFLLAIFPIIGFALAFSGLKKVLGWLEIIKVGQVTFGTFFRKETTGASVNEQQVYRFFFKFYVNNQEFEATGETYKTYKLTDEQYEPLIYNPTAPSEAIMIDGLPGSVRKVFTEEIEKAKISQNNF